MAKFVLKIGIAFVALALLLFICLFAVVYWPKTFLNPYVIKKAAEYASHFGFKVDFDDVKVDCKTMGFLDNRVKIEFENICAKSPTPLKEACFEKMSFSFRYEIIFFTPLLKELGPAEFSGGKISYIDKASHPAKSLFKNGGRQVEIPSFKMPRTLRHTKFSTIEIGVEQLNYTKLNSSVEGKINLDIKPDDKGKPSGINFDISARLEKSGVSVDAKGELKSLSGFTKEDEALTVSAKLIFPQSAEASLKADVEKLSKNRLRYSGNLEYAKSPFSATIPFSGSLSENELKAAISLDAREPHSLIDKISASNCNIVITAKDTSANDGTLKLNCPATLNLELIDLPDDVEPIYRMPHEVSVMISSNLDTFFVPDEDHKTKGTINIGLKSSKSMLVETSGNIAFNVDGKFKEFPNNLNLSSNLDVNFNINDFSRLAEALKSTKYAVPAPFRVFGGQVVFSLKGSVPSLHATSHFPIALKTSLESKDEKMYVDAKGDMQLLLSGQTVKAMNLDLDVELTDVKIELPNIELAGLPNLVPDHRITLEDKPASKEMTAISYKLNLTTPDNNPMKIVSNISEKPIPIHLNLNSEDGKFLGRIQIDGFSINLFRKKGLIKGFTLDLNDPFKKSEVSGDFQVSVSEYTISILVKGPVDNPNIWFESSPPLSEENIIAVLMYGEPFDDLDTDQALSIGNMKAAMSNKALALTTFLIFASTPVHSVIYNQETRQLTAQVKLGERTSFVVGSTGESRQGAGLRHRLGKGWIINTTINEDKDTAKTAGTAFIEWHKRY